MVFPMLSTESLMAAETVHCQHWQMADTPSLDTVSGRLDYVIKVCEYPTQTELAAALGLRSPQVITNWRTRDSVGRGGSRLREVTGVSTDWMTAKIGEPFPDGPILYSGPAAVDAKTIETIRESLDQLGLAIIAICHSVSARSQAEGRDLRDRLGAALREIEDSGKKAPFLKNLRDKVLTGQAHKHSRPSGKPG